MTLAALPVLNEAAGYLASSALPETHHQSDQDEIWQGIDQDVLIPILDSRDIAHTFRQLRDAYGEWRHSVINSDLGYQQPDGSVDDTISTLVAAEDELIDTWRQGFQLAARTLEPAVMKALLGALDLRQIVSHSTWPHIATWPAESWDYIEQRMISHELCMLCVSHHVTTRTGLRPNVQKLAIWGFKFVEEAYYEAGRNGKSAGPLERIA